MFLPWRASETLAKRSASLSAFLQPATTMGLSTASATALASATQSSTDLLAPLGSARSKRMHTKSTFSREAALAARWARVSQPA